jgi:hypothetical protein
VLSTCSRGGSHVWLLWQVLTSQCSCKTRASSTLSQRQRKYARQSQSGDDGRYAGRGAQNTSTPAACRTQQTDIMVVSFTARACFLHTHAKSLLGLRRQTSIGYLARRCTSPCSCSSTTALASLCMQTVAEVEVLQNRFQAHKLFRWWGAQREGEGEHATREQATRCRTHTTSA